MVRKSQLRCPCRRRADSRNTCRVPNSQVVVISSGAVSGGGQLHYAYHPDNVPVQVTVRNNLLCSSPILIAIATSQIDTKRKSLRLCQHSSSVCAHNLSNKSNLTIHPNIYIGSPQNICHNGRLGNRLSSPWGVLLRDCNTLVIFL